MELSTLDEQDITKELSTLDEQIATLNKWIIKAGSSLMSFHNEHYTGGFWRDTHEMADPNLHLNPSCIHPHPTCTHRAFFALYEYLRFLHEEDLLEMKDGNETARQKVSTILQAVYREYLLPLESDPNATEVRESNEVGGLNMFTDSLLLTSVSLLKGLKLAAGTDIKDIKDTTIEAIRKTTKAAIKDWRKTFFPSAPKKAGGRIDLDDEVHDLITLFFMRAIDVFCDTSPDKTENLDGLREEVENALREQVQEDVLRLIALQIAGVGSSFDATQLTFGTVLLGRLTSNASKITASALDTIKRAQEPDGGWPTPRLITTYERLRLRLTPSYEVALELTDLLIRQLYSNDILMLCMCKEKLLPILEKAFELVKSHYNSKGVDVSPDKKVTGWTNDHIRHPDLIESWSTAVVLTFLIHYHDALCYYRQLLVLKKYDTTYPEPDDTMCPDDLKPLHDWPDMTPALRRREWTKFAKLEKVADPTEHERITKGLQKDIVNCIAKDSWIQRPEKDHVSLIFYGPPGARKTTLSQQLAKTLQWPLITLSPPDFLRKGLEGMEVCAAEIFNDLLRLRRVVILFDECEDFFKSRPKEQALESRTIGAFITAGMLPRLEKLHKKQWVVFILATNSAFEDLDEAVRRPGRFDYAEEIGYPTLRAQCRYINHSKLFNGFSHKDKADVRKALVKYNKHQEEHRDDLPITFAILDALGKKMKEHPGDDVLNFLEQLVRQKGPRKLDP